jgi:exodeoxyribonuclease VII large subunit
MGLLDQTETEAFSVSVLTEHIKMLMEGTFHNLWVSGEISDLSRPRSGHLYFTLKDDKAQIRAVIWKGSAERIESQMGRNRLADGDAVLCQGDVDVYAPRGQYQLIVRKVQTQGLGRLQRMFQELQAKLNAEGLFDADRKRPLPAIPRRIGVITSPSGAAIRDFLKAAATRFAGVDIIIFPASVQGPGAAESVARAIRAAEAFEPALDALLITRGGGSLEDLWCFNEELLVRAVSATTLPVVSAIGHEIDVTLCDLAADVRALTPTDAANHLLPDRDQLFQTLEDWGGRMHRCLSRQLEDSRLLLRTLEERPVMRRPHELVQGHYRELDELEASVVRSMRGRLQTCVTEVQKYAATLDAMSPLRVLSRGYSMTTDVSGQPITAANQVVPGDVLRTRVANGEIRSVVTKENAS